VLVRKTVPLSAQQGERPGTRDGLSPLGARGFRNAAGRSASSAPRELVPGGRILGVSLRVQTPAAHGPGSPATARSQAPPTRVSCHLRRVEAIRHLFCCAWERIESLPQTPPASSADPSRDCAADGARLPHACWQGAQRTGSEPGLGKASCAGLCIPSSTRQPFSQASIVFMSA
jgi:hypothetical protein